MNDSVNLPAINMALLQQARTQAMQSRRSFIVELEEITQSDPRELVQELAATFGLAVTETAEMLTFTPALDLLPASWGHATK